MSNNKEEQHIGSQSEGKKKFGKRKLIVALVVLIFIVAACFTIIFFLNAEQDINTILESELLQSHGINISRPDSPYYTFGGSEVSIEVALCVFGEHGTYYFTPSGWTDKRIKELVLVSEDGIHFAKDILGIEVSRPLSFVFNVTEPDENHPFPIWGGGGVLGVSTFISMDAKLLPSLIVHEAAHAILRYDERMSNFPHPPESSIWHTAMFFEEGLCNVIDFLFYIGTEHEYDNNLYGRNRQNVENHLHTKALWALDFNDNFENKAEFGTKYPQLMSYDTAASFIYFLLNYHGTLEDFMRVFDDIYLMEEVFGQNMVDMIAKWMEYLSELR